VALSEGGFRMPLLVTQSLWLYLPLAAVCLLGLFAFVGFVLNRLVFELWMKRTSSVKSRGYVFGPHVVSAPAMVFLLLSLLVYAVATYLGQVGYAFAWYAIVAAADIFASPLGLFQIDPTGKPSPMSPRVQKDLLHIDLVMDALIAAIAVGATYLFQHAVVLA
jgi:hypothetical protein